MSLLKRAAEWPGSSSECHGVSLCLYSVCMMWVCQQCLTHGVHRQCSPPRVGAVVLVVLTSRLGWRRRARTPQSQLATQYRLVERQWDRQAQKHRERERGGLLIMWPCDSRTRKAHYSSQRRTGTFLGNDDCIEMRQPYIYLRLAIYWD